MTVKTRFSSVVFIMVLMSSLIAGCGGGGGSSLGFVSGILTDGFGAIISHPAAVVSLDGTSEFAYPGGDGSFTLSAAPGTYILRGQLYDPDEGFLLDATREITVVAGETATIGTFAISDNTLEVAWESYRKSQFNKAENEFKVYLNDSRSAQAHVGASSALSGLGWTRGRGLDNPVLASENFQEAIAGWGSNTDAYVGLAACELSRMKFDGGFHFNQAMLAINAAIDIPGNYSSSPTHDQISEVDLYAYHAFVDFLNGNTVNAKQEAQEIQSDVATGGNSASSGVIEIVLNFLP